MSELARFTAHGHPALRASHGKTLEITAESEVTGRATCVLGVAATMPPVAVAGPIRITLSLSAASLSGAGRAGPAVEPCIVDAIGNSAWQPGESAVVRRSAVRLSDTYATDATVAASDLSRPFAAALADPDTVLSVSVTRRTAEPALVRFRLSPCTETRLRVEADAADAVLAEDAGARTALARLGIPVSTERVAGRVLSVSSVPGAQHPSGVPAEVIGWPVELAVSAAADDAGPVLLAPAGYDIAVLAAAHPESALVFAVAADRLARTLSAIGRPGAGLMLAATSNPERPWPAQQSALVVPDRGELIVRIAGRPGPTSAAPVEPAAFVRGLLAEGVSARTIALALAGLPGWSRRVAYDFVLAQQGETG